MILSREGSLIDLPYFRVGGEVDIRCVSIVESDGDEVYAGQVRESSDGKAKQD